MKIKALTFLIIVVLMLIPVNALSLEEVDLNNFSLDDYDIDELSDLFNTTTVQIEVFDELDYNHDGNLTIDEFEELAPVFYEDSFWDGYALEEIIINEFENYDEDFNDILTFDEYCKIC